MKYKKFTGVKYPYHEIRFCKNNSLRICLQKNYTNNKKLFHFSNGKIFYGENYKWSIIIRMLRYYFSISLMKDEN